MLVMQSAMFDRIEREILSNDVVLYMKGSAAFPQCNFSATVVQILSQIGVTFRDVDVSGDGELRQGLRDFANWPTLPQLYIKGEFIGGADIIRDMFQTGELQALLKDRDVISA
jgi:monothiol glutaredoxin